jgi:raffinose/stachyose/melibiose transport system permease protein
MMNKEGRVQTQSKNLVVHVSLLFFVLLAIGPIFVMVINSFKTMEGIFTGPLKLPSSETSRKETLLEIMPTARLSL